MQHSAAAGDAPSASGSELGWGRMVGAQLRRAMRRVGTGNKHAWRPRGSILLCTSRLRSVNQCKSAHTERTLPPPSLARPCSDAVLPCRTYLRHCVLAARALGRDAEASFLDGTLLADRETTVRQHLARDPGIMVSGRGGEGGQACVRAHVQRAVLCGACVRGRAVRACRREGACVRVHVCAVMQRSQACERNSVLASHRCTHLMTSPRPARWCAHAQKELPPPSLIGRYSG